MIIHTHIFNLFAKLLFVFTSFGLTIQLWVIGVPIPEGALPFILCSFFFIVLLWPIYYFFLRSIANWLYCALALRAVLHWSDLKVVACLFDLDCESEWRPMTEIRKYRPNSRRKSLLEAAKTDTRRFCLNRYF